jgi:hypothetical protein
LNPVHKPQSWTQDYRTALPYDRYAFEKALVDISTIIPFEIRSEIIQILRYLCEPDPKLRGHPQDLGQNQFSLERTISTFDLLATKAEYKLFRK